MATEYDADVKKFAKSFDEVAVVGIKNYLGIALRTNKDAALVSCSDKTELDRVREKLLKGKLARAESDDKLDSALAAICEKMKGVNQKSRVTFYYLCAEHYGQLSLFHPKSKAKKA